MKRREFIGLAAAGVGGAALVQARSLGPLEMVGRLRSESGEAPVPGSTWYVAESAGDGIAFRFERGALSDAKWLTSDMLLDGALIAVFTVVLREGERGRSFRFSFGALPQCSLRMRLDLALVDQGRWLVDREGAFLKPLCSGDRVDLRQVDRVTLTISRKGPNPVRWCMTPVTAMTDTPPRLTTPILPKGPLVDEFGQSTLVNWSGKTHSAEELTTRIRGQFEGAAEQQWPDTFSRWGGSKARRMGEGTGWFRTHHDGRRWWLVDPDGFAFWSAGLDCVRVDTDARVDGIEAALKWTPAGPEFADAVRAGGPGRPGSKTVNFLAANMVRTFGGEGWRERWSQTALGEMKRLRFNTVGNWSEWEYASRARFPYVRPLNFRGTRSGMVYRDFPDVFHEGFERDAAEYAEQLQSTASDPALIGYFLMNEPTWAFSSELPAAGMLYNAEKCATREELAWFLRRKYEGEAELATAWKSAATFERVAREKWQGVLPEAAIADLREFSLTMVARYFQTLSKTCRQADPKHLNLGMRWQGIPKDWAVPGMKGFDVFSLNCYQEKLPAATAQQIASLLKMPVLVGEWHFGALDVGLPASGIGNLKNQAERGRAYRVYFEDAAADPYCVGVHWFTMYDQSALGRFDGENYNIGFFDVCNRGYDEMRRAAMASHERMYEVAAGEVRAFGDAPEYLGKLYL